MVAITILGAGITGMAIASQLPRDYKITILGKHLPGDPLNKDFASPWTGACWVGVHVSSPKDQKLQLDSFAALWKLAKAYPEPGVRISDITEILEYGSLEDIWYRSKVPGFRLLSRDELPSAAKFGMTYKTVVISPPVFLSWMRSRLEARGVKFGRISVQSLGELKDLGHDVLINATGAQSKHLKDVSDSTLVPYRLQSIIIEKNYNQGYIYRGNNGYYFNMFGRPDGTTYVGGIKMLGSSDRTIYESDRQLILSRGHQLLPDQLPSSNANDYQILYDIATTYSFRPQENGGARIEKEILDGQKVVHANGQEAGGYCYSFGLGRAATELVADYIYELPTQSQL